MRFNPRNPSPAAGALLVAAPAIALLGLSCRTPKVAPIPPPPIIQPASTADVRELDRALTDSEAAEYAGDEACASCHPSESEAAGKTRHARTLSRVTVDEHGEFFRKGRRIRDPLLDYEYLPAVESGTCILVGKGKSGSGKLSADFAFGSGRNAFTYMCRISDDEWIDLRLSYYPGAGKWDYTPMQKPGDRQFVRKAGIVQSGAHLVSCLLCHSTVLRQSDQGVDIDRSDIGIGCERCHGPARSHVESARLLEQRKANRLVHLEDLKTADRERIGKICGACHRTPENAPPGDPKTENGLARFQGAALARSACFRKSPSLSCVTCHDPHEDANPSPAYNEAKCLSCHIAPAPVKQTVCPVNPRSGCIPCHMPAQKIATIPYAEYHNHWIKVWKKTPPRQDRTVTSER